MSPRTVSSLVAAVLAAQAVSAALDCSGKAEWDIQFIPGSYVYDPAAVTTKMCYSVAYKQPAAAGECAAAGGQAQALTKFGARFLSCFTNENAGLRADEGTWDPVPSDEGYAEETMDGEVQFNGNLWTNSLPATGSKSQYCVTMERKLNLSQTPNTEFFATDGSRFSITSLVGPECYLAPTTTVPPPPPTTTVPPPPPTTTVPPPPPTTTVPPPSPTTTVPPPPPTTTVPPPPPTTTVPPTTTTVPPTPEPSAHYSAKPEEVDPVASPSAGAAAPALPQSTTTASPSGMYVGAAVGASVGAGLLAAAAAAYVYKRRAAPAAELPSYSQEVLA